MHTVATSTPQSLSNTQRLKQIIKALLPHRDRFNSVNKPAVIINRAKLPCAIHNLVKLLLTMITFNVT